jgi:putative transposase
VRGKVTAELSAALVELFCGLAARRFSVRRACTLLKVARSALSYRGRKAARDASVVERMRELSAQSPRYGYRRMRIFLRRDGYRMSPGRAYRLWRAAGLQWRC